MKTTEENIIEVILIILLFIAIAVFTHGCVECSKRPITSEDIRQLEEMRDYHYSQGRNIIVFE